MEKPEFLEPPAARDLTARDPDLEAIHLAADKVGATGVQVLVAKLQNYRHLVRQCVDYVDYQARFSERTESTYRLKDHITAMNSRLSELEFALDLDHVDLNQLTDD